ncbi:MAG: hypothetical protein ABI611_19245 [Solirubrobacteraceae bacterium]
MRPRRQVHPLVVAPVKPAFRYSQSRDAYVLRVGNGRRGPVRVPSTQTRRHAA